MTSESRKTTVASATPILRPRLNRRSRNASVAVPTAAKIALITSTAVQVMVRVSPPLRTASSTSPSREIAQIAIEAPVAAGTVAAMAAGMLRSVPQKRAVQPVDGRGVVVVVIGSSGAVDV